MILTLFHQCDSSLYIIKAACSLFILLAVLFSIKSPSLHPLLIENYVVAFEHLISQKPLLQLLTISLRSTTLNKWLNATCFTQRYEHSSAIEHGGDGGTSDTARAWAKGVLALTYSLQVNLRVRHAMTVAGKKISALLSDVYPATGNVCLLYDLNTLQHAA